MLHAPPRQDLANVDFSVTQRVFTTKQLVEQSFHTLPLVRHFSLCPSWQMGYLGLVM